MPVDRENGSPPYIVNPVYGNKHSQSRALRIMARNQGWDPDAIVDVKTGQSINIANFNKDPDSFYHRGVGQLPEGIHDTYPQTEEPRYEPGQNFSSPVLRETKDHKGEGRDPYSGMGGM